VAESQLGRGHPDVHAAPWRETTQAVGLVADQRACAGRSEEHRAPQRSSPQPPTVAIADGARLGEAAARERGVDAGVRRWGGSRCEQSDGGDGEGHGIPLVMLAERILNAGMNRDELLRRATDPRQYDAETLDWPREGVAGTPAMRFFESYLA